MASEKKVQLEVEPMVAAQHVGTLVGTQRGDTLRTGNPEGAIQVALAGYAELDGKPVIVLCVDPADDFGPTKGGKDGPSGRTRAGFIGLTIDKTTINMNAHTTTDLSRQISSTRAKARRVDSAESVGLPTPATIEDMVAAEFKRLKQQA